MNKLQLIDADTLYYKPLAHPKMLIDGVLSDGLAILAGDSKIGKSWMVLWLCLQISRGEAAWGLPTRKTDVVYLALEDREWRVQQRMQELTDSPPENLRFGFSCGQLGAELEGQIEETLREFPTTGLIFIDTLQMVRDNASAKVNAYAQDYKDLSSLKKLADDYGICIFVVHHTRKERDSSNIFNDMTGSTGILGVADTGMILRKDDRFGDCATLCITGRDVEEKKLKMQMRGVRWEITEALSAKDLRKERIPDFVFQVADFLLAHGRFRGTVSQLLAAVGNTELKPNLASKHLTRHYSMCCCPWESHTNIVKRRLPGWCFWSCMTVLTVMTVLPGARNLRHCGNRMTTSPGFPKHRHKRHLRHGRRRRAMRNCRFKGCGAIHRFFIRKDNEHGICVAVRHPIPPYLPIRKGRAPVTPLKGCDIYAESNRGNQCASL